MNKRRVILGVDIGGTKVCLALVSEGGELLRVTRYPLAESAAARIPQTLLSHIDAFLDANADLEPSGIGVGLKAMVGPGGAIIRSSILRGLLPYDMRGALAERYRLPTALDNDVHAAALAEIWFGAGQKCRDFVYLNLGTGAAAGLVADGRLVRGHRNCAGEVGCCLYPGPGGAWVPFEDVASGKGLADEALRRRAEYPDAPLSRLFASEVPNGRTVLEHFRLGDPLAAAVVDQFLAATGVAMINLSLLLDPALFVLGGGVLAHDGLLKLIERRVVDDCARYGVAWTARVEPSPLGVDEAGVLGAAAVWLNESKDKE